MTKVDCKRETFECFERLTSPSAVPIDHNARKLRHKPIEEIETIKRFGCNMKSVTGRLCQMTPSKLLTLCSLILVSMSTLEGSHHGQQQFASNNTNQVGCPHPAVNSNCQVNIIAQAPAVPLLNTDFLADEYSTLKQDTQAAYKCDHGYELLGSEQTTCLASGRWSAPPPNCVTNIALGKPTNQSSSVRGGDSRNANDGKLVTQHEGKHCTETKVDQSPWWQIDLLQVYEIRSIRILGRACCNPHLSLHDIEIRVGNSSNLQGNRLCAWYPNNLDEGSPKDFQCAHPILGRFVSIQMVGIESALSLCEVMVFSTREFPADRCSISSTVAPSQALARSSSSVATTTSASAVAQTQANQQQAQDNQIIVFNRTCYETQAANGGSFLVADTYCKARGGSLLHSVNDLTQLFISQELERMKPRLKSKLVWLGAKREQSSPNAQGPITPGSTSALVATSDGVHRNHHTFALISPLDDRSALSWQSLSSSQALHEFPIESLFSNERGLSSAGESSSIFGGNAASGGLKLARSALLQASTGAGGATSRGSQTFGLQTAQAHQKHHNSSAAAHSGRSLIVSQPSQVASFFTPPVPISPSSSNLSPVIAPTSPSSSSSSSSSSPPAASSSPISFLSNNNHVHRTLRPPSLASTPAPNQLVSTSWNPSRVQPEAQQQQQSTSSSSSSAWRWTGDAASETLLSPITNFLWADDQPNNYNNQQDCIVLDGGKRWLWNDVTCELDYLPWVCQYRAATCGSPDRHENSTILEISSSTSTSQDPSSVSLEANFQLGKIITYACPIGHRLDGSRQRKCLYDGNWSGRAPKCHYVNCGSIGAPSSFENGRIVYLNQSQTTFGSQAKYVCYEDYVLVGDDTRQCQTDGKWAGKQPYCAYKWCPRLEQISNGLLNVSGYGEGSLASYQCNSGYKLIGNDTRQCLLGGKWTNQEPFCQYVECGQPKQIQNGAYELVNGTTNYLSIALYTCDTNYTLVGGQTSNKLTCSHNNRWTGREPQCALINCGQPQANAGSRFSGDSFTVHSIVEYKCEPGFKEVAGNVQRTCGLDGQWTGQPLTCKYLDCGRVPAILKGEVSYINGTTYLASQVAYECTPGNRIAGHKVRFCGPDGRWTGSSPKCEEVRCDAPELPANGSAIYIGNDRSFKEQSFSVGVTVQYECDYGHVVTGSWSSRLCQANGEWSGEPPVCKFVDCGQVPTIDNGQYLLKHPPAGASVGSATQIELTRRSDSVATSGSGSVGTYYGTIAQYSCDNNYKLMGPAQRECLETGHWRRPLPSCEPIQCPKPEFFDVFTQVALLQKGSAGHLATDETSGQATTTTTTMTAASVKASAVKLIANSQWINQHANQTTFNVGDKLLYSCSPGYELYGGPEWRTCTQYAQWSGSSTPRCRLIDCGRPAPIGQEGRFYLLNETTTFNSLVEYTCVRPFKLVEVKIRQAGNLIETLMNAQAGVNQILTALPIGVKVCANNGQWMPNDQQPKCTSPTGGSSSGAGGQFDGGDNTLDGSDRQVSLANGGNQHPTFINNLNSGQDGQDNGGGDNNNLNGDQQQRQHATGSQSAYFWAKVLLVISLPLMFAIITVTLICIRSKKTPKQAASAGQQNRRTSSSILTPGGHAGAMQIQLASNGKALHHQQQQQQQQQSLMMQQQQQVHHHQASIMAGHVNGNGVLQKMFPPSQMVGQSQMSSGSNLNHLRHHQMMPVAAYGDAILLNGDSVAVAAAAAGPAVGRAMALMNGIQAAKANSLSVMGVGGVHSATSAALDSYSRLSIESNGDQSAVGNKTIRHNPNGLVTFVSPLQQQQKASAELAQAQSAASSTSSSSGISSSGRHHQHQISPQSISTSLSVTSSASSTSSSASMSPSSSNSSSAPHTNATRLSANATDSTCSPSSMANHSQQQQHQQQQLQQAQPAHHLNHYHQQHQQQSEYEAPQQFHQQSSGQQTVPAKPPSLPAHPPPPHRVQQQFKQLMKHQQVATGPIGSKQQAPRAPPPNSAEATGGGGGGGKQQVAVKPAQNGSGGGGGNGDHHYMEPAV